MRSAPFYLLCCLALAFGCRGTGPAENQVPDSYWEGEVRIIPGDTTFAPCGTTDHYQLTGPGLDSIAHRYAYLQTVPGQWIKTWCSGHMTAPLQGKDSVLQVARYMHMDSETSCPPVPNDSMTGSYVAIIHGSLAEIKQQVMLLPGGDAVMTTTAPDSPFLEDDAHWGLDADKDLILDLPQRHTKLLFTWQDGHLASYLPNGSPGPVYEHRGPADRMQGSFGRTARWLAAVASAQGKKMRSEDLRPTMTLDSLFPDPADRAALRASAVDTLGMTEQSLNIMWGAADNVKEVNALMRSHIQAGG